MKWLINRIAEPSTYAGLPLLVAGLLSVLGVPHSEQVGSVVTDGLTELVSGDGIGAALVVVSGLLSIFLPEKARR